MTAACCALGHGTIPHVGGDVFRPSGFCLASQWPGGSRRSVACEASSSSADAGTGMSDRR